MASSESFRERKAGKFGEEPDELLRFERVGPEAVDDKAVPHTVDAAGNLLYQVPTAERGILDQEQKKLLGESLRILDSRAQDVIRLRFGLDGAKEHTFQELVLELGPKYGFRHHQQPQRVLNKAFDKLKKSLNPTAIALRQYMRL